MRGSLTDAILAPHRQVLNVELAGVVLDCPGGERVPETVGVDLGHASLPAEVVRGFFMQVATESTMMRSGRTLMARITIDEPVSYTHLRAHETRHDLVCRLLLEKK